MTQRGHGAGTSPLFHVATAADWAEAQRTGRYTTSTRGRTLAEEGFVHAARADQWQGVRERYYADVTEPLVLLVIDPDRLDAPVVEEEVPGGETFPHVYGAIAPGAVTRVVPLAAAGGRPGAARALPATADRTFFSLFAEEMAWRAGVGLVVVVVAVGLGLLVLAAFGDVAGLATILVLLVLGTLAGARVLRRRAERLAGRVTGRAPGRVPDGQAGTDRAHSSE